MSASADVLIIDPALRTLETGAYNLVSDLVCELSEATDFTLRRIKICAPVLGMESLASCLEHIRPAAVLSLGSYANVTDSPPWLPVFLYALERGILTPRIPFMGICFTHQLLALARGGRVGFVARRDLLPERRWFTHREVTLTHPKARLLLARFDDADYGSRNGRDLAFREALLATRAWTARMWVTVFEQAPRRLTAQEGRIRRFIENQCDARFVCSARHEQEVDPAGSTAGLTRCAASAQCAVEGFVGDEGFTFTFQTHLETPLGRPDFPGRRMLKTFLYGAALLSAPLS